jgi:kynurenine formamidase
MGRRLIDLTLPVQTQYDWTKYPARRAFGQWEPPTILTEFASIEKDGLMMHRLETTTQSFTHFDAPRHFYADGLACDEVPLDQFVGEAAVFDLLHKQPGEAVHAADLEAAGGSFRPGDIALLRTGWTDRAPWGTERMWREMISLEEDACDWLLARGVKSLALDFQADVNPFRVCSDCGRLTPSGRGSPNHRKFLGAGVVLLEWLTNLAAISRPRVLLVCLPLKLVGVDGAPMRAIAIEDD